MKGLEKLPLLMADMGGRIAVGFLKSVGKIIAVVEAAGVCNITYSAPRLIHQNIFCPLQSVKRQILAKSEGGLLLEESREMLRADGMCASHVRKIYLGHIAFLDKFYSLFDKRRTRVSFCPVMHVSGKQEK